MSADTDTLEVTAIPAVTAGPISEEHTAVLLWAYAGTATVEVLGVQHPLSAGQALWVPPGLEHCTRTEPGGVVLPIFPRGAAVSGALSEVRVVAVPPGWEDWLVYQFDWNGYHSEDADSGAGALLGLIADSPRGHDPTGHPVGVPSLPMPRSWEARRIAQTLLRNPGSPRDAHGLASRHNISVRTLQRQFVNETGMVFSEWRTRARVTVAAAHLAEGAEVGATGRQVGFVTPAGFTRAFRRHFGVGPRDYARRTRAAVRVAPTADQYGSTHLDALVGHELRSPPAIPARRVWNWVFDWHVLWWMYRGSATVQIGAREFALTHGEAIWLPAGYAASVGLAEGAILLPLGNRFGGKHIGVGDLDVFSLRHRDESALLHAVLAEYTLFRPDAERAGTAGTAGLADELFREQFTADSRTANSALTGAAGAIARALRQNPADSRSLTAWAKHLQLSPREVGDEFLTQIGVAFPLWRGQLRMSLARELLRFGDPPHEVAPFLGYASVASFSKVFTAAHGVSPRQYQRGVS